MVSFQFQTDLKQSVCGLNIICTSPEATLTQSIDLLINLNQRWLGVRGQHEVKLISKFNGCKCVLTRLSNTDLWFDQIFFFFRVKPKQVVNEK